MKCEKSRLDCMFCAEYDRSKKRCRSTVGCTPSPEGGYRSRLDCNFCVHCSSRSGGCHHPLNGAEVVVIERRPRREVVIEKVVRPRYIIERRTRRPLNAGVVLGLGVGALLDEILND